MVLYVILIIIMLLFLICLCPVKINFIFHRQSDDDYIEVNMEVLKVIKLKYKIPTLDIVFNEKLMPGIRAHKKLSSKTKEIKESKSILNIRNLVDMYDKFKINLQLYRKPLRYLSRKTRFTSIVWHTSIGTDDAAYTAVISGVLWGVKANIINYLIKNKKYGEIDIKVAPDFSKPIFESYLHCIIKIQIANIIIGGIRILLVLFYNTISKKGGESVERTSYSGVNENNNG